MSNLTNADDAAAASAKAKLEHGDDGATAIEVWDKFFALRYPPASLWRRWGSIAQSEGVDDSVAREEAYEALAYGCLLYPEPEVAKKLLDRYALLPKFLFAAIQDLAIGTANGEAKKL